MSATSPLVDLEAVIVPALAAALSPSPVSTEIPAGATFPRVRITLIGGSIGFPPRIEVDRVQVEAFGGTKVQAFDLIQAAHGAVVGLPGAHPGAVISHVLTVLRPRWDPDPTDEVEGNSRPRYLADYQITAHSA